MQSQLLVAALTIVFLGLLGMRTGRRFGFDFASQTLLETVDIPVS